MGLRSGAEGVGIGVTAPEGDPVGFISILVRLVKVSGSPQPLEMKIAPKIPQLILHAWAGR